MRRRVQISFLSVFLTLLTVAFAAALVLRVRSYSGGKPTESAAEESGSSMVRPAASTTAQRTTYVPLPDGATPSGSAGSGTSSPSTALTRAQRFRELLAMGVPRNETSAPTAAQPPAKSIPPPAPPAKSQSMIAKLVQPIVNALRPAGSAGTAPQQAAPPGGKPNSAPADPRDPNSDTVPPQLLSINFDPPQVQDGGDTTLVVMANDDLSGIRGISGTLTSPNGKAVQGFAVQREGETMRYISRIHIPEKAEEGIWRVTFLTMSDMATNTVTLSAAAGSLPPTATLKVVSSASDSTAPTLRSVWLERPTMRAGEHNTLYVDALDEKSGIRLIAAVFLSPSKQARFGVGCHKGSNDVWECDIQPSQCLDCGDWTLEQVQLQDNANNFASAKQDNPVVKALHLNIGGDSCDSTPPVLQGLTLSRSEVLMGRDEPVVEVVAQVSDDGCGVGGVSGQIVGPGSSSSGTFFSLQQRDGNTYAGTIRLHANSARGVWRLQSLTVGDKGQNLRTYYANDPLLARAFFVVK